MLPNFFVVLLLVSLGSVLEVKGFPSRSKRSDDLPALQPVVDGLSNQLSQQSAEITALKNSLAQLQQQFQQHHATQSQHVAFYAGLTTDSHLLRGQTLKFDQVSTNQASAYDPQTGIFTVPLSGVYVFLFSTHGNNQQSGSTYLQVNGKGEVYVDDHNEIGTGHGVFHLNRGERVWVVSNSDHLYSYRYDSYFSGFLINPDW